MRRCLLPLLAASVLCQCCSPALAGRASEMINALSSNAQAGLFKHLIDAPDSECRLVSRVFFKGESPKDDSAYYAVRCEPSGDWMVAVKNTGNMPGRVVSCAVVKPLGVECWTPY